MPDGIFTDQKYQFWSILAGLGMEKLGIFYGQLEFSRASLHFYIMDIGNCFGSLVYFPLFWYIVRRKIWQP
jgi:hypothetical protein